MGGPSASPAALRFFLRATYDPAPRQRTTLPTMPDHELPLIRLTRHLDGGVHVGEALFFPEVAVLHGNAEHLGVKLRALAKKILAGDGPADVYRRLAGATPEVSSLLVALGPPRPSPAWTEPVTLRFDTLRWRHGEEASIAYVPALGIEVVAARDEQLDELLARHVRTTLARTKMAERLFELVQLGRVESVSVERDSITADVPTPAQAAAGAKTREASKPVIENVGRVLDEAAVEPAYAIDALVDRLGDALAGRNPRSVLLVGASGVGKTAAFGELFRRRGDHGLGDAPFWTTSGARLIAGTGGYGMWQERCQTLCSEARKTGAVLHLGNLVELMEVGKAGGSRFGIASFFRPYLARGDVLAVAECTPEQLPLIERANPHLLAVFHTIRVEEPSPHAGKTILLNTALSIAAQHRGAVGHHDATVVSAPITEDALDTLDRLHRRYATYSAAPGRPLRFLKNLLQDRPASVPPRFDRPAGHEGAARSTGHDALTARDVTAAFSRETGLPLFLVDDATPLDLVAAHGHFASRVIGQPEAVDLVTDLLATVKAALNRPRRPIASLLFVGPTGVGKTEMAKALADYFFGNSGGDRLLRFDMSEYSTPAAVARLVGTAWDAEGLLTRKVREQPFCVILLDEFEKAHPSFFDLLLQVLGEARLTDPSGRVADFSNAIVCMTSNLGAQDFASGPFGLARATTDAPAHARGHFTDAVRDFLRPELFNRIDRVVPFLPLGRQTIERIAYRELDLLARRDGILGRALHLDVSPDAVSWLAGAGYDPTYGARPLKRRIEQDLLAPLAEAVNQYAPTTPLTARVGVASDRLRVDVRATRTGSGAPPQSGTAPDPSPAVAALATRAAALRRRVQALGRCPANLALQNELFTLHRLVARKGAHPGRRFVDPAHRERGMRLQALADALAALGAEVTGIEDALLLSLYDAAPLPMPLAQTDSRLGALQAGADELLLHFFSLEFTEPHAITLGLFGAAATDLFALAHAYREAAIKAADVGTPPLLPLPSASVAVSYYTRLAKATLQRTFVARQETESFLSAPRPGVLGIVLSVTVGFARARFETERGLHVVQEDRDKNPRPIWVDASVQPADEYRPPKDVEFRVALAGQRRRTYTLDRKEADDAATAQTYRWTGKAMYDAIVAATAANLYRCAEAILEP
jgi:ATP-dependent Clp protease ATP-binding subunit ClpC